MNPSTDERSLFEKVFEEVN